MDSISVRMRSYLNRNWNKVQDRDLMIVFGSFRMDSFFVAKWNHWMPKIGQILSHRHITKVPWISKNQDCKVWIGIWFLCHITQSRWCVQVLSLLRFGRRLPN